MCSYLSKAPAVANLHLQLHFLAELDGQAYYWQLSSGDIKIVDIFKISYVFTIQCHDDSQGGVE